MKKVLFIFLLIGMVFSLSYAGAKSPPVKLNPGIEQISLQVTSLQADIEITGYEFVKPVFENENALIRAGQFTETVGFEFAAINRNFYNWAAYDIWKLIVIPNCNRLNINKKFLHRQMLGLNNSDYSQLGYSMRE
jgi:hypothetical protein